VTWKRVQQTLFTYYVDKEEQVLEHTRPVVEEEERKEVDKDDEEDDEEEAQPTGKAC
jgi:hypothetical protein